MDKRLESYKNTGKGNELTAEFWDERWKSGQIGWDIGYASPPLVTYMDQYVNKNAAILIPGCGNAYEAEYLSQKGFSNITLLDISKAAVNRLKDKFSNIDGVTIICNDFFDFSGQFDLILEQTFFCAQIIERREAYVQKVATLLKEGGKLVGVLFGVDFGPSGPPFGGDRAEYQKLFEPYFQIKTMEPCYNSIKPRSGAELFIILEKKP
ncbi:MAG: methyltransferase domain-containing protein [Saprospiraceae bacterium]|nr:MAG: SAM-dependent methlyltransferase [Bacteroidetes bacterium OLB9]MCO6463653.1 methyltransferase domain-containing protein [Saprospiraceae bacterium]